MKRLYYLAHSVDDSDQLVDFLHHTGVGDWHIHGLSNDDAALYHHHIHPAHFFQRYDLVHLGERGALIGFLAGLAWTAGIHFFNLMAARIGLLESVLTISLFTLFGAWSGGMVGLTRLNYRISRFRQDIEEGACLIIVDIQRRKFRSLRKAVRLQIPNVIFAGSSSTFTNPFAKNSLISHRFRH